MTQPKTLTLSLGEHWNSFISERVETHRYASASEVVRTALRLLEETEANSRLEELRSLLQEGEDSGDAGPLDMKQIRKMARKEAGL